MSVARDEFDRLVAEHGLYDWRLAITARMTSAAGYCHYQSKTISIAEWLTLRAGPAEIIDTVRHEVAHAIAGQDANHGPAWRRMAIELGARPEIHYPAALSRHTR
jgi:predicted SprT family Zn-dependent metalloprotease